MVTQYVVSPSSPLRRSVIQDLEDLTATAEPLEMLEQYFGAHGWAFERLGEEEIVTAIKGAWNEYQLQACWREDDQVLQLACISSIRVPESKRLEIYETLGRINERLWIGHFEMWSEDGTVLFRHSTALDPDLGGLSFGQTGLLVDAAIEECERYYPVFQFVLWAGKSPADALVAALVETHGEA